MPPAYTTQPQPVAASTIQQMQSSHHFTLPIQTVQPFITSQKAGADKKKQQQQQTLLEQQLKQELGEIDLDSDSSSMSSMLNKQFMSQPQKLDNNAIQTLLYDQTKSHLIIDDKEELQVKSGTEFISLFRNSSGAKAPSAPIEASAQHAPSTGSSGLGNYINYFIKIFKIIELVAILMKKVKNFIS